MPVPCRASTKGSRIADLRAPHKHEHPQHAPLRSAHHPIPPPDRPPGSLFTSFRNAHVDSHRIPPSPPGHDQPPATASPASRLATLRVLPLFSAVYYTLTRPDEDFYHALLKVFISQKRPSPPFTITPRQRREGEGIYKSRGFAQLQQERHDKINTEHTRLDKYISGIQSRVQLKINKWPAENHREPTALSSLNIAISAYRLSSEDYHFIYDVGAWEHRLWNALLDTSKHVPQTLKSRFQVQAIQRSQADQARAIERIQQERRRLGSGVPTEDFPTSYWEFLQLTFDTRRNALHTHSDHDPEEAVVDLRKL
ncbi:hypothetical protein DXG01_003355 [Tephrocybe rancida]|nr:hypothetical protein DXG01_003355 [Tephrocybe rancida]